MKKRLCAFILMLAILTTQIAPVAVFAGEVIPEAVQEMQLADEENLNQGVEDLSEEKDALPAEEKKEEPSDAETKDLPEEKKEEPSSEEDKKEVLEEKKETLSEQKKEESTSDEEKKDISEDEKTSEEINDLAEEKTEADEAQKKSVEDDAAEKKKEGDTEKAGPTTETKVAPFQITGWKGTFDGQEHGASLQREVTIKEKTLRRPIPSMAVRSSISRMSRK